MSNTFYEAAGQNWFTLDSVHIQYNWTQEATFNASEVYAPATSSYHCQHVSSLHKYDTLLVPSSHTDTSANWHITFTDFQVHCHTRGTTFVVNSSNCVCMFSFGLFFIFFFVCNICACVCTVASSFLLISGVLTVSLLVGWLAVCQSVLFI